MTINVRALATVDLRGSLVFGKNLTVFPEAPREGEVVLKDGVLWMWSIVDGVSTWYPLTNKRNTYVHTQAVEAYQWTVNHNLGTPDVLFGIYDDTGSLTVAASTPIDDNSFRLNFTSAITGRVVVFADSEKYSASVSATAISASSLDIASGTVVADSGGLRVSGQDVATLSGGVLAATQVPNVPWTKVMTTPTTLSGYGIADAYTKVEVDSKLQGSATQNFTVQDLIVTGNILPSGPGLTIGSPTQKFLAGYFSEVYIDASTLYVDGVPLISTDANTIQITADPNQGIRIGTAGTGQTIMDSQSSTVIQTNGINANVLISAGGTGSQVQISSNTEVRLTAPTVRAVGDLVASANASVGGNLTVAGNLVVQGTQSTVNSTTVTVTDNIVVYNSGEVGSGVTNRYAGFQVDRGDLSDARLVWDEQVDKFVAGLVGSEVALATESYVTTALAAAATADHSHAIANVTGLQAALDGKSASTHVHVAATVSADGFMSASDKTKLDGIAAGANAYVHPDSGAVAGTYKSVTVDAQGHIVGGANPTTLSGYGITDAVSATANQLPLSHGQMTSVTLTAAGTGEQVLDMVSISTARTVKFLVQVLAAGDVHSTEILATHNGLQCIATEYATVLTGPILAAFSIDISGGSLRLLTTPTYSGAVYKVLRTTISV